MAISGCGGLGSGGACSASTRHAASAPSSTSPLPSGCSSNRCLIGLRGLPARWSPHSGISSPRRRLPGAARAPRSADAAGTRALPAGKGRLDPGEHLRGAAVHALCAHRSAHGGPGRRRAVHFVELFPGGRASARLSALHPDRPPLHPSAIRIRRLSGPLGECAFRRALGSRGLAMRARPCPRTPAGLCGGIRPRPVAGFLDAVDHRRGLHPQQLLPSGPGISRSARRSAPCAAARARGAGTPPFVDGVDFRPQPEQSLAADAAGHAGLRSAPLARSRRAAASLRVVVVAGDPRPAALPVDGNALLDGHSHQLRRPARVDSRNMVFPGAEGIRGNRPVGVGWLADRYALRRTHTVVAGVVLLGLILAVGARSNLASSNDWAARYAQVILRTLPKDAVVFAQGEADLAPMAYFLMIENWRPDVTLYHAKGLILGNRMFHPLRTDEKTAQRIVGEWVKQQTVPVVSTLDAFAGYAKRDRWIYIEVDKSSADPRKVTVEIPEEAIRFFEESVVQVNEPNAWISNFQGELRRRYATLLAQSLPRGRAPDERSRRHLELLAKDYYGALGIDR